MNSGNTFSPWFPKPRNVRNASVTNGVPAAGASHWGTGKFSLALCADKGYAGRPAAQAMQPRGYTPHVRQRGEEARACRKGQRARRWVVERTHSWFNRFRKLLVRYEKTAPTFWRCCNARRL